MLDAGSPRLPDHAVEIGSSFPRSACPPDVIENSTILRRHPCGEARSVTAGRGYVLAILLGLGAAGFVLWQLESSTSTGVLPQECRNCESTR